jgi:peptidoglycan/LPS O-acetylase OafA/YrhL
VLKTICECKRGQTQALEFSAEPVTNRRACATRCLLLLTLYGPCLLNRLIRASTESNMMAGHMYRPDVDGLRAIAIFIVVLYHLGNLAKGGYVGVDVFFVISGYLITQILVEDIEFGRYSLVRFYERRVRRIFPALFACLFTSALAAWMFLFPGELETFAKSAVAATFFLANHYFLATGGYFQPQVEQMPLIHTWSLAVEEQFYLFFPLLVLPLVRRGRGPAICVVAVIALASLAYSQYLLIDSPTRSFYILPSRAWELMLGSLLALGALPDVRSQRQREVLSALALLAILVPAFAYNKNTLFPGLMAAIPCLGAAVLIHTGRHADTAAYRLLSSRPFVFLGLISYSLYLWHVPIISFYRLEVIEQIPYLHKLGLFLVSLGVAYVSWRFVEQPFRARGGNLHRSHIFGFGFAAMAAMAGLAAFVVAREGLPERYDPDVRRLAAFTYDPAGPLREGQCFVSREASQTSDFDETTCLATDPKRINVLIMGDSHAAHLWAGFTEAFPEANFLQATASGCAIELIENGAERCRGLMQRVVNEFLPRQRIDAVIVSKNPTSDRVSGILPLLDKLKQRTDKVFVIGPVMQYTAPLPRILARSAVYGDPSLIERARKMQYFAIDEAYRAALAGSGATYVSMIDAMCPQKTCTTTDGSGAPLQHDSNHLTTSGAALLGRRIAPVLGLSQQSGKGVMQRQQ